MLIYKVILICYRGLDIQLAITTKRSAALTSSSILKQHVCSTCTIQPEAGYFRIPVRSLQWFPDRWSKGKMLWVRGWGYRLIWISAEFQFTKTIKSNHKWMWWPVWPGDLYRVVNSIKRFRFYCASQRNREQLIRLRQVSLTMITWASVKWPQTNNRCHLRSSFHTPFFSVSHTMTYHKYIWCSRFSESHSFPSHQKPLDSQDNSVTRYNVKIES